MKHVVSTQTTRHDECFYNTFRLINYLFLQYTNSRMVYTKPTQTTPRDKCYFTTNRLAINKLPLCLLTGIVIIQSTHR